MILKWSLFVVVGLFGSFEAAFVDTLKKCHLEDEKCLIDLIQNVLKDISTTGIEEVNIPPIDPIELKDINVSILNLVNITMVEGNINGFKDCVINHVEVQTKNKKATFELTCDVSIKGKHRVTGSSEVIQNLFGSNSIHGEGNFKLDIKKLHLTLNYYYTVLKKEDGEVYFNINREDFRYNYEIEGLHIDADNIYLGDNDASKVMVEYMNQNWKFVMQSFGGAFFDVAVKNIFNDFMEGFFQHIPAKDLIIGDV